MKAYLLPGILGLLTSLILCWTTLQRPTSLRKALSLRRGVALSAGLSALGWAMTLTALMCWLAVIDVDAIRILPLSAGALAGGLLFGTAAGLGGLTPSTAFTGLAFSPLEALCTLLGCLGMTWLLPTLSPILTPLQQAEPYTALSLCQLTLEHGFLTQGCAGGAIILSAMAVTIGLKPPASQPAPPEPTPAPDVADPAEESTVVALLPGEEPLVIDTALDESQPDPETE